MPFKDPEKRAAKNKEYLKRHYRNNTQQYIDRNMARKRGFREIIRELKNKPCADCQIPYPYYVMQFDHRDPKMKLLQSNNCGKKWQSVMLCAPIAIWNALMVLVERVELP